MRIFVLGHKGFLGQGICEYLSKSNIDFIGIDTANYDEHKGQSCDLLINANGSSKKRLADTDPGLDFKLNVVSTLSSLIDFKYQKYIYISTIDVYPDVSDPKNNSEETDIDISRISNYGLSKYFGEQLVEHYAANWLIIRLGGMVGKGLLKNSVFDVINYGKVFVNPKSQYQYMNTSDVGRIIYTLRDHDKEIFNLCGDETIRVAKLFDIAGKKIPEGSDSLRIETYHINISKIKKVIEIPLTEDTVAKFMRR